MRLTPDEIEFIARKVVKTLQADGKIEVEDEPALVEGLIRVVSDELHIEDKLNVEVRELLVQYSAEMQRNNMSYSEMFKKVKRELAKQKGIVL